MGKKIDSFGVDILKEAENIGAGSASTALSNLTGKKIKVKAEDLKIISLDNIYDLVGGPDVPSVGMILGISGGVDGSILLFASKKDSLALSDIIQKENLGDAAELGSVDMDAIQEMGNILVGAYLTALSTLSGMNLIESTPNFITGKAKKIGNFIKKEYRDKINYVYVFETLLNISGKKIEEKIVLLLTNDSFNKLFNTMIEKNLK
ncbi:chemotaxis protein CheC [Candidatus Pacearchaeota archaeon]|nr:chemotaxis protein CheC [Candidatus Pacearchaeota archaeon]